jgi:hypothetical protein
VTTYTPAGGLGVAASVVGQPRHTIPSTSGAVAVVANTVGAPNYVQLLTGTGYEVRVYDVTNPNTTLLAVVPNPETVQFEDTISDVGSGQVTIATNDMPAAVWQKDHIWKIYWEGVLRFAFIAEQIEDESIADDEIRHRTIAGRGVGQWVDKMKVYPTAFPAGAVQRPFTNVTYASIYRTLLNEAHARGTATFVTPSAWTAANDSEGAPWTDTNQIQVAVGTSMLDLLTQFSQALPFDWHVDAQFGLALALQMGQDKSASIRVQPVGSVIEATVTTDTTNLWDEVLIQDSNNQFSVQSDATAIAAWNRREQFASSQTVSGVTGRADLGLSLLNQWKVPAIQRLVQVDTSTPGRKPFVDYGLGDFISVEFTDGSVLTSRVIAIAMAGGTDVVEIAQVTLDFDIGKKPDAGTTTETSLAYTGPVTIFADNGANALTIGTSVTPAIAMQLVAGQPTLLSCDTYIRGQASAVQTMTATVYIDGNPIRTMQQIFSAGQQTWAPTFVIPSIDAGTHSVQLRLSVDTGTFSIAAFDLQHWYTGNGLQGGVLGGNTLIEVVDTLAILSYPTVTTHATDVVQTPVGIRRTDSISGYVGVTDIAAALWSGYFEVVANVGDDGATSSTPFFTNNATAIEAGNDGGNIWGFFVRFVIPAPGIPSGVTIRRAFFTGMPTETDSGLTAIIHAERAAGPAAPTSRADFLARTRTTASVAWNINPTVNVSVQSPSLTAIIQELVTNYGGSITAIQLFVEDNGSPLNGKMLIQSLNHASPVPAALTVMYS